MPSEPAFQVKFWGVTGSYPRPLTAADIAAIASNNPAEPLTYGGDTTCVQIDAGPQTLIVDAGTGMQRLNQALAARNPSRGVIFLTHAHLDHVCSLPFFEPFYDPHAQFTIYGAPRTVQALRKVGEPGASLAGVFFPQTLAQMPGLKAIEMIEAEQVVELGDVRVTAHALNHPGGCLAYRFERGGKRIVIATDHEQPITPDASLAAFAREADLLYLDAQYLREEYDGLVGLNGEPPQSRVGWGHTPLESCIPTADAAGAKRLCLGHHEPRRSDAALRELAARARAFPATCEVTLTYQGLTVEI